MIIEQEILNLAQSIRRANWDKEPTFLNVPRADGTRRSVRFSDITVGDLTQVIEDRTRRAATILNRWRKSRSPHAFRAAAHAVAQANRYALLQQCCHFSGNIEVIYKPFTLREDEVDAK